MARFQGTNLVSSVDFNGTNTQIAYSGAAVTGFATASSYSGWLRIKAGSSTVRIKVGGWGDGSTSRCGIAFQRAAGSENYKAQAGFYDGATYTTGGDGYAPLNEWFHLAFTWDGTTARTYIDGVLLTGTGGAPATSPVTGVSLGNQGGAYWFGQQTNTKIYTRVLTQDEVTKLSLLQDDLVSTLGLWVDWRMGEGSGSSVTDYSGNGRTGTITSGTYVYDSPAKPSNIQRNANAAILANGIDGSAGNALSIPNNASLNPTAAVTLEIWFRPTALKAGILFDNSTVGTTNSYFLSMGADGSMNWFSTIGGLSKTIVGTAKKAKFFEWNCVSATYNGSAVLIFLNGSQLAETLAASGALGTNSGPLRIGAYYSGGISATFLGNLSQPRVYAAGCTLAEHQDRYYRSITSTALQAGLVLDLNTQLGAGSTVTDLSGLGNHATMGASASWTSDSPFKARKASVNANMVKNGDFEYAPPFTSITSTSARWIDGTSGGSLTNDLFGWYCITGVGNIDYSFDSTVSHSGGYSLRLRASNSTGRGRVLHSPFESTTTPSLISQYGIPVLPNTAYTLTGWIKTLDVVASSVRLTSIQFDGGGTVGTSTNSAFVSGTSDWTQVTASFVTASTAQYVTIKCDMTTAGAAMTAWFDDISLTPVYPEGRVPANGNLVKNFDFEVVPTFVAATTTAARWIDGTAGGSTTNSTYKWATVSGAITPSASVSYDTTVFHGGTASLKLSTLDASGAAVAANTLNTASPADANVMFRLLPSTAYTLTFYLKTNNVATNGAFAFIREYSGALSTLVTTNSTKLSGTNDWTLVTLSFTTNALTQFAALALLNNVPGNISDAWFDDIYLGQ